MSVVSEATMEPALGAASSTDALTVRIGAASDTNRDGATNADDPVRPDTAAAGTATAAEIRPIDQQPPSQGDRGP